ncbi:MAG: CPBP family glutamic-type intramembrane protease [Planctomycetaceae bacterium]
MNPARRGPLLRFGAAVGATLVVAPVAGALLPRNEFHSVLSRVFLGSLLIAFLVRRGPRSGWLAGLRGQGLRGPHRGERAVLGLVVSLLLLLLLLALSWALGGRIASTKPPRYELLAHIGASLVAGFLVSFLEEWMCRGYLKDVLGGPVSALIYAAVHFLRPLQGSAPAQGYDPLLALKMIPRLFESFGVLQNATLGILGLFLFGLALNRLRERTGTLYLGIGLHAGLVAGLALYSRWLERSTPGSRWIFGGARLYDGLLGILALGLLLLAAWRLPLPARLTKPPPPS